MSGISKLFSPIGRNIVNPQTHYFSEIKKDNNWLSRRKQNSSYYQPQPATDSLNYKQQTATYNQFQQYCQDRRTQ